MKALLDTHALLWWLADDPSLSAIAIARIDDPTCEIMDSAASVWEICTKHRIGKLPTAGPIAEQLPLMLRRLHFTPLAISVEHGQLAGRLTGAHKDPFDRMLAAQAILEGVPLVTSDAALGQLGCEILW